MLYVILFIVLLIFIFCAYIFFKIIKLKEINNSLELCTAKIEEVLNKKLELVKIILEKLNNDKLNKEFKYDENDNIYDKEKNLFDIGFNINKTMKASKSKKPIDEIGELNALEETIDGLKDFYNAHVLNYNEIFLKKYINKIYRLFKFKDYKSFKIRKLEEYEIFKV